MFRYRSVANDTTVRAYSIANYPDEKGIIMLNVCIATPLQNNLDVPPGIMSSYIWSLKDGDRVTISGPFGELFAKDTNAEMVFIGVAVRVWHQCGHTFLINSNA